MVHKNGQGLLDRDGPGFKISKKEHLFQGLSVQPCCLCAYDYVSSNSAFPGTLEFCSDLTRGHTCLSNLFLKRSFQTVSSLGWATSSLPTLLRMTPGWFSTFQPRTFLAQGYSVAVYWAEINLRNPKWSHLHTQQFDFPPLIWPLDRFHTKVQDHKARFPTPRLLLGYLIQAFP